MRKIKLSCAAIACAGLPLLAACGPDATASSTTTPPAASSAGVVPPTAAPSTATSAAATTTAAAAGVNFTMPNLVGQVLQDAQNALHGDGIFYSRSHDLLGSRHQVLDRDWKVCTQNVPPGQQVTGNAEGQIDFGVVKLSEGCP